MPEIGLSGLPLDYPHSGTAVYARNLVPLLPSAAPELDFRLFLRWATTASPDLPSRRLTTPVAWLNRGGGVGARADKLLWETVALPMAAVRYRESVIHSLTFTAPIWKPCAVVVTIHDLVPLVVPGYHRGRSAPLYSALMARAVRGAAGIITVSNYSHDDIVRVLGFPEDRVWVTPEAADPRFSPVPEPDEAERLREIYDLPSRYLLYLGGSEKRKNIETLVSAWASVEQKMRSEEVALVIVANFPAPDPMYPDVPELIRELGLDDSIRLVPSVDEDDKPGIYRQALGFCFPSTYEGFGLTPLEAMACGTPVICSSATSLPEVVGDAGWLLAPHDVMAWAEAMALLVDSGRDRESMSYGGIERANTFGWQRTAEQTAAVYREILSR